MLDTIIRFFQSGGPFMYPITVVLAIGIAISIERYFYLTSCRMRNQKTLDRIMALLEKGRMDEVIEVTRNSNSTVSNILIQGLAHYQNARRRDDIEASMEESILEAIPRLEKRTHYLAMFANIATLLGLLGTIIGLIKAFTAVAQVDPAMKAEILSTSISVAMNTTAFGLMVAIPLLLLHSFLQTKTNEIIDSLEMATVRFVNTLVEYKNQS